MPGQSRRREIGQLLRKKGRVEQGAYLIEGIRLVESAVLGGALLREILVTHEAAGHPRVAQLLDRASVPVSRVEARWMRSVSDLEADQGLLAIAELPDVQTTLPAACRRALVLDGIQDPGNVGTLIRTAAWFGVEAVVAGPGTADLFSPKVVRSTMGGLWDVLPLQTDTLGEWIEACREQGFVVYGGDLDGEPADLWRPATPSLLVLGSEAHGLSNEVTVTIDRRLLIPRAGTQPEGRSAGVESLNVSVAGALLLYHWTR